MPAWLITRYDDVRRVLSDAATFSSAGGAQAAFLNATMEKETAARLAAKNPGSIIDMDPPGHTRLRRLLTPEFTVKRMRALRPRVEWIVNERLDAMEKSGGPVDLVQEFALPVPSLVICELLGVPYEDRDDFQRRSSAQTDFRISVERRLAYGVESSAYMGTLVAKQRLDPGDDLLGMIVREHGDTVSDEELAGLCALVLFAGHETTASMLGMGALLLLLHPDQAALVRDDPEYTDQAVEELMRYLSAVNTPAVRTATRDVTIGDQLIRKDDAVVCSLPLANRDESLLDDPDVFDIRRKPVSHVALGHGIHHCLGAPLARMEMRIAFPALLRRFPKLRPAVPLEEIRFRPSSIAHGLQTFPVTW
ncbi:cytochrome P450 [Spongiactinospora sp. 9N601]|uniref:cytochrome P450 n=1 Tax=Spongiactinospora sp. 9N601 TaxID=3375149 RepID=UPI00378D0021